MRIFIDLCKVDIPKQFLFFQCFHRLSLSYHAPDDNCRYFIRPSFGYENHLLPPVSFASGLAASMIGFLIGAPGVSRTRGPQIRNLSLYPSELQGQPFLYSCRTKRFNILYAGCQLSGISQGCKILQMRFQ